VHDYTVVTDPSQCSATLRMCTTTGKNAEDQGKVLGPATTVALVAGGAGVAAAGIWLGVRRREKKPEAGISLVVRPTAGGAALGVGGRW
jgi:LPXTG-motif cell wall-anchored protein